MFRTVIILVSLTSSFWYLPLVEGGDLSCSCSGDCSMRLNLSDLGIQHIQPPFIGGSGILELLLHNNGLKNIVQGALSGLINLQHLDLSHNLLLPSNLFNFGSLPNLGSLNLNGNYDPSASNNESIVPANSYLPNLQNLSMQNTSMGGISPDWDIHFPQLGNLDLSHNPIDPSNIFSNLPSTVHHLYLRFVALHDFKMSLIKNLTGLALDGNIFSVISSSFKPGKSLSLGGVPSNFSLQELSLSNCGIQQIEDDAFNNLRNLLKLNISGNLLSELNDGVLASLQNLQFLDISKCPLTKLPNLNLLTNLSGLFMNNMGNSGLFRPLYAVLNLPNLTTLSLSGNNLVNLDPNTFSRLPSLSNLDLSNNNLSNLLMHWNPLTQLQDLHLGHNLFQSLGDMFLNTTKGLGSLNIGNNPLQSISSDALNHLPTGIRTPLDNKNCDNCCASFKM